MIENVQQESRTDYKQISIDIAKIGASFDKKFTEHEHERATHTEKELFIIEQCTQYRLKPKTMFNIIF